MQDATSSLVKEALARLGIQDLVLSIHDASFPSLVGDDSGRGTPYSAGADDFLAVMTQQGFTGLLLGPQGQTSLANPSPYDGTVFSKNILSVDIRALMEAGWLPKRTLHQAVIDDAQRVDYRRAFATYQQWLARAHQSFVLQGGSSDFDAFVQTAPWLKADALYHALLERQGGCDFTQWPQAWRSSNSTLVGLLPPRHMESYAFAQWLLHRQHAAFLERMRGRGIRVYGDLQVGISRCDLWRHGSVFLQDHWMGAPPSRTNPLGQPWGYAVLDPLQYQGAAGAFLRARLSKLLDEFDGVRIDHPHGLVCPWVYARGDDNPLRAVQQGSRLFSSPDRADLAAYAIARAQQLDHNVARYADHFVTQLDESQITQYATLFDIVVAELAQRGRPLDAIICEVLSTQPYELGCVLERYGLGRFRVTQKAVVQNADDVYRADNAAPNDWLMVGNHDTPPMPRVLERWRKEGELTVQARYLAQRLTPTGEDQQAFAATLVSSPHKLLQAKFADLFVGPAQHVLVFWADLFGMREIYNRPGEVHPDNWTLRLPSDWRRLWRQNLAAGDALDVPGALAMAVRARGLGEELAQGLEAR